MIDLQRLVPSLEQNVLSLMSVQNMESEPHSGVRQLPVGVVTFARVHDS